MTDGGELELVRLGSDVHLNWIAAQDAEALGFNPWDPDGWVRGRGFQRGFGDAAVMSPFFEVLVREEESSGSVEYLILCPTFLRRPLVIRAEGAATHQAMY